MLAATVLVVLCCLAVGSIGILQLGTNTHERCAAVEVVGCAIIVVTSLGTAYSDQPIWSQILAIAVTVLLLGHSFYLWFKIRNQVQVPEPYQD